MKRLLITIAVALAPGLVVAQNPDIRPSVRIRAGSIVGSGEFKTLGFEQDLKVSGLSFAVDFRLPVNESLTLTVDAVIKSINLNEKPTLIFIAAESDITQYNVAIGLRFYFGESVNRY